ncbi:MAG: XRE family transcriptional regulator [Defluviitaleaceae bacterium]|nr:XRE family transcriptional regulator [Defluviitaleaceae bacterium]MCL2835957.1 XRE family transcriptional regulator [Defluviitaleaceae bacterium]
MELGGKIKQLRIKMNLTQEELAGRCDLSKGFISQLERDKVSPSIATLMDILDCLGSNLKDFFNSDENERVVFTRDDIFERNNAILGHTIDWLIPNAQKNEMEPILLRLDPGGKSEIYPPYESEVFGYVLSGSITLHLGKAKNKVRKGESFYYKANDPHYVQNNAKTEAVLLWVSSPPSF